MRATIEQILFPVDFSASCAAMAPYVKRAASMFGARVTLVHVFDFTSHNGFELYVRLLSEIAEEHQELAREELDSFLAPDFPVAECPRILSSGDVATRDRSACQGRWIRLDRDAHTRRLLPADAAGLDHRQGAQRR